MLDEIAQAEGGTEEETTYDGRKWRWTQDARKALLKRSTKPSCSI